MGFIIAFALMAALLNSVSSIIQRREAGEPAMEELFRKEFSKRLTLDKIWILGFALQTLAFFAQAAALKNGSLVLVEPLLTVDLIFLMLILHFRFGMVTGWREWGATAMICLGLSGLLDVANPQVGNKPFDGNLWLATAVPFAAIIAISVYLVRRTKSKSRRAGIAGLGAGFSFALVAMLTKLTLLQLNHGVAAVFGNWQVYGLLAAGILSVLMAQNAYGAGPVAMSQPVMEVTEPLVSVFMGIILFGDRISFSTGAIFWEALAGAVACIGIWMLGRSENLLIEKV